MPADEDRHPQAVESVAKLPTDHINPRHDGDDSKLSPEQKGLVKKKRRKK